MATDEPYPQSDSLKGHFLMAMPGMMDPNFSDTVTCICEHTNLGSVGLIVNRIHSGTMGIDIFKELNLDHTEIAASMPIFFGGPVHTNEIFILHGPPFEWEGCFRINDTLAMSNTVDILASISMGKGPESYLICLGCAGWGPGQLESEIKQNAWITSTVSEDIIFNMPNDLKWKEAMKRVGVDPVLLSVKPGHA